MDKYVLKNGKKLRCGYTTGACACASAKAAVYMLLTGKSTDNIEIELPGGEVVRMDIKNASVSENMAECSVTKDGGDDTDITSGLNIFAKAERAAEGITIECGEGIGKVTKPGLSVPVGEYAINPVPRRMIYENVGELLRGMDCCKGVKLTFSIPGGEETAKKTFNPRLGIEGGLSIIGTTGIVEPMSSKALMETIRLEINQKRQTDADKIYLTPGNIGNDFIRRFLGNEECISVCCSNFIGESIDECIEAGFEKIMLVGHIGKLVKLGYGARNTHSANNDGRMECIIRCALEAGAGLDTLKELDECVTTDAAVGILKEAGVLEKTMEILGERIEKTLIKWTDNAVKIGFICFTGLNENTEILIRREI